MKHFSGLLALACTSHITLAGVIYDQDSQYNRSTAYSHGPVSEIEVVTSSTQYIQAFFTTQASKSQCVAAALYNDVTGEKITDLEVNAPAIYGELPSGNEMYEKSVRLQCQYNDETYVVHHKVPAAPKIVLNSSLIGHDWQIPANRTPGYYKTLSYTASLFIDNHADDGVCYTIDQVGRLASALPFLPETKQFNTDHFSVSGDALYNPFSPYIVQLTVCKNAGGTTRLVEQWEINQVNEGIASHSISTSYQ